MTPTTSRAAPPAERATTGATHAGEAGEEALSLGRRGLVARLVVVGGRRDCDRRHVDPGARVRRAVMEVPPGMVCLRCAGDRGARVRARGRAGLQGEAAFDRGLLTSATSVEQVQQWPHCLEIQ